MSVQTINRPEHIPGDEGCSECRTCIGCDSCADEQFPLDLARGDCAHCGACGDCRKECAALRRQEWLDLPHEFLDASDPPVTEPITVNEIGVRWCFTHTAWEPIPPADRPPVSGQTGDQQ
jgi:hypothetical protein